MSDTLIDNTALKEFMKDDSQLLLDLSVIFVRYLPNSLTNLQRAVELRDSELLCETVHQLKGQLSYFFCNTLVDCALEIEEFAHDQDMQKATAKLDELTDGIDNLIVELNRLTKLNLQIQKD